MAPLCISGLGWSDMSPGLFTHPVWDGCIKAFGPHCLPLPFRAACFDASPSLQGLTPPPFASTRLMGYGYVSATSRLPPTCERIRHLIHVSGRAYELLAGLSLTLFRCAHGWSRTTAHANVICCLAPSCSSHGRFEKWLAALPAIRGPCPPQIQILTEHSAPSRGSDSPHGFQINSNLVQASPGLKKLLIYEFKSFLIVFPKADVPP